MYWKRPQVLGVDLNRSELRRRAMEFGVRTGKPPASGESVAANLEKQWNLRALESLAADGSVVPTQNGQLATSARPAQHAASNLDNRHVGRGVSARQCQRTLPIR
jgi:hypothetical protein